MTRFKSTPAASFQVFLVFMLAFGCGQKSTGSDAGTLDAGTDAGMSPSPGLTISRATNAAINGTYALKLTRAAASTGGGFSFNGNFNNQIEMEVDIDSAGTVIAAHVWNYKGTGAASTLDKFYGCDGGKTTACTGVSVNLTTNIVTLATVTWPEVDSIHFDGSADTKTPGGGTVTAAGVLQAM